MCPNTTINEQHWNAARDEVDSWYSDSTPFIYTSFIFTFEISASVAKQRSQHTNCSSVTNVASHLSKPYFTFDWEAFQAMHLLHCRHSLCLQFTVLLESSYCTEQV